MVAGHQRTKLFIGHHIIRKLQMRRSLAAVQRTHHRLTRKRPEHRARGNLRSEFRDRPHHIDHVDDLVLALLVITQRLLTR